MGWIDQQLKNRAKADQEAFRQAFDGMAGVVMDKLRVSLMKTGRLKMR